MTVSTQKALRIAAFGFRSFPPRTGAAGADKFALELLPRLAQRGHRVLAYNRIYPTEPPEGLHTFNSVDVIGFRTVANKGFDTLLHSAKVTWDIIRHNRADIVHIQNGGNSIFAALLRLFGKRTFLSQDGIDWKRAKWPWYARLFLWLSSYLTAHVNNEVIFDNIFAKESFEKRFGRRFAFIPFGADVDYRGDGEKILEELRLEPGSYFLFVGRFIPDKGLHYLVEAFAGVKTDKKLVLVGGSPNPSKYEDTIRATSDARILFPGYIYGPGTQALMKHCFAYIQPSDIEGLSPVILESAFLGAPVICSDIEQNKFAMDDAALYFHKSDVSDLRRVLAQALDAPAALAAVAQRGQERVQRKFTWDSVVDEHLHLFGALPPQEQAKDTGPMSPIVEQSAK